MHNLSRSAVPGGFQHTTNRKLYDSPVTHLQQARTCDQIVTGWAQRLATVVDRSVLATGWGARQPESLFTVDAG
jgi:hypothetical protein